MASEWKTKKTIETEGIDAAAGVLVEYGDGGRWGMLTSRAGKGYPCDGWYIKGQTSGYGTELRHMKPLLPACAGRAAACAEFDKRCEGAANDGPGRIWIAEEGYFWMSKDGPQWAFWVMGDVGKANIEKVQRDLKKLAALIAWYDGAIAREADRG